MPAPSPTRGPEPPAERMAAARALFEGVPGTTIDSVAAEVGVTPYWIRVWKRRGSWSKRVSASPQVSARAGALADTFKVRMSELGKPLDDSVAAQEAAREVAEGHAVRVRAEVLDRHRKEWSAPRKIAYEAMQEGAKGDVAGAFERAKLAKITAETLTLIQAGECRAFGITPEAKGADTTVVVVERSGGSE